ncbi:hypothetical protein Pcinc_040361 [Petrolisthes cinctipes]|uniref:Uncharacterized protein n=1 Tax=Petrolisthes cinctipes TaxID=88211 RepID=A0AAE1EJM7_PETCI|nr:hypothetical protein Pcinc_040361 [Petrolisthes cinctipes]
MANNTTTSIPNPDTTISKPPTTIMTIPYPYHNHNPVLNPYPYHNHHPPPTTTTTTRRSPLPPRSLPSRSPALYHLPPYPPTTSCHSTQLTHI